jgi:hypothetical protein
MASSSRPRLVGTLLAGAEQLAGEGHTRSALTEAVTALEVALFEFARNPAVSLLAPGYSTERVGLESLHSHVDHLGLTASLHYLLPLVVPEELLSSEVLKNARKAVAARQTVVHGGQRTIAPTALREFLGAIREVCAALEGLTAAGAA